MAEQGAIERGGARIAYEVSGEGPAIVLNHSFLCNREMWRAQVPALAQDYRVINIDTRGHGASSLVTGPCTPYDCVTDVLAVLDDIGVAGATWAGLSLGGFVALRAALIAPERVSALMLLDTDGGPENAWRKLKFTALGSVARRMGLRPVMGQIVRQMFGATSRRERPDLVAEWARRFSQVDVPSMLWILDGFMHRDDLLQQLPPVDIPALVLVGCEDVALPPARSRRLAEALLRSRLVEVPGAGHLSTIERPEEVTAVMLAFLRDHE